MTAKRPRKPTAITKHREHKLSKIRFGAVCRLELSATACRLERAGILVDNASRACLGLARIYKQWSETGRNIDGDNQDNRLSFLELNCPALRLARDELDDLIALIQPEVTP